LLVTHDIGSYLVEQILNLGSEELFQEVYAGALQGRLLLFAVHPVANFVLQRYLSDIKNKEHVRIYLQVLNTIYSKNVIECFVCMFF